MDLPQELSTISALRRQSLERRRLRERAAREQTASGQDGPVPPYAMVPAHLCDLFFVIFLLLKLDGRVHWHWAAVMSPLWAADLFFIFNKSVSMSKTIGTMVHPQSELYKLVSPSCGIVDHVGVALTKATLVCRLEGATAAPLLLLFLPLWASVLISGVIRCCAPINPSAMGVRVLLQRFSACSSALLHFIVRGLQPLLAVLRADDSISAPWAQVLIPAWTVVAAVILLALALCNCAPLLARGVGPEMRPMLARYTVVCGAVLLSLAFCAFLFLYFLALRLDGDEGVPPSQFMAPLIALYAVMLVAVPWLLHSSNAYYRAVRAAAEVMRQATDPQGGEAPSGRAPEAEVCSVTGPALLSRESATLYRRVGGGGSGTTALLGGEPGLGTDLGAGGDTMELGEEQGEELAALPAAPMEFTAVDAARGPGVLRLDLTDFDMPELRLALPQRAAPAQRRRRWRPLSGRGPETPPAAAAAAARGQAPRSSPQPGTGRYPVMTGTVDSPGGARRHGSDGAEEQHLRQQGAEEEEEEEEEEDLSPQDGADRRKSAEALLGRRPTGRLRPRWEDAMDADEELGQRRDDAVVGAGVALQALGAPKEPAGAAVAGATVPPHGEDVGAMAGTCFICCEHAADAVIMECGHGGLCFSCGHTQASRYPQQCPVCREPIQQVLRIASVAMAPGAARGRQFVRCEEGYVVLWPAGATPSLSPVPESRRTTGGTEAEEAAAEFRTTATAAADVQPLEPSPPLSPSPLEVVSAAAVGAVPPAEQAGAVELV